MEEKLIEQKDNFMDQIVIINRTELKSELALLVREVVEQVFDEIQTARPPEREIMTLDQLAERWQVHKQTLIVWTRRAEDPLPVHYVGGDPRFHIKEVDSWSKTAANRRLFDASTKSYSQNN